MMLAASRMYLYTVHLLQEEAADLTLTEGGLH